MENSISENNRMTHPGQAWISWPATFAGLAVSLVSFILFLSIAVALGGIALDRETSVGDAGGFAGIAVVIASLLAAFVGAYFATRCARFFSQAQGAAQGFLVGAVLTSFLVIQVFTLAGSLGAAAAKTLGAGAAVMGAGAAAAAESPMVRDVIEDQMAGMNLKSQPGVVIQGVASRLLRGQQDSAKNYLADQAGLTPEQADEQIIILQGQIDAAAAQARQAASAALRATGWSLTLVVLLSLIGSVLGGLFGATLNTRMWSKQASAGSVRSAGTRPAHV